MSIRLTKPQEEALVDRLMAGDASAFDELETAFREYILAVLRRVHRVYEVDDSYQDAIIHIWKVLSAGKWKRTARLATFIYRVTFNLALMELRKKKGGRSDGKSRVPRFIHSIEEEGMDQVLFVESRLERDRNTAMILNVVSKEMRKLYPRNWLAVHSHYILGMSYPEMVEQGAVGSTLASVKSTVHRGKKRAREIVQRRFKLALAGA